MDISIERTKPDTQRLRLFSVAIQVMRVIARQLIGFFSLSEEEQRQAGIYRGGEGRDG